MRIRAALKMMHPAELLELVAYYEDLLGITEDAERVRKLQEAFGLPKAPAWLLSRLAAADGRLVRKDALIDHLPANDNAFDRHDKILDVHMVKVRKAIGADAIESVRSEGWRLTPLGRLRIRRALGLETL